MRAPRGIPSRKLIFTGAAILAGCLTVIICGPGGWSAWLDLATIAFVLPTHVRRCRRRADFEAVGLVRHGPATRWRLREYFRDGRR